MVRSTMERDVGLLRLYPGIPAALVGTRPGPVHPAPPRLPRGWASLLSCHPRHTESNSYPEALVPGTCTCHGDLHALPQLPLLRLWGPNSPFQ